MLDNVVFTQSLPKGLWDRIYLVRGELSYEQQQKLIEWLSSSCEKNFIFLEKKICTLAGGYSDNHSAWMHGRFKEPEGQSTEYEIRLHQQDCTIFELTWHKNIQ